MAVALEQFVKQIEDSGVISPGKLHGFVPPQAHPKDAQELAQLLVRSKFLTKFQAQEIYAGRAKSLILGNYTILDRIGAGGMGQVFKAQHRRMERIVAIKILPKAVTKDAVAIARFQREVVAAAKLSHPNIVAAYDADEAAGVHFLAMEHIEGRDLSATVKKLGTLPVAKALHYVLQAARGLEFAHKKGVIHRDIKPGNLLLDSEGTVKILDMGLARLDAEADAPTQAELTGTGAVMGTVDYMAPEQALSTKHADARADIYSLGCTLYYLLTGKAAYEGDTLMAKLLAHRDMPIPSLGDDVPDEVQAVFAKMVAKKVADRYQTMSDVIAALEACVPGQQSSLADLPTVAANNELESLTFLREIPVGKPQPAKVITTKAKREIGKRGTRPVLVAVGAACLGIAILAAVVFTLMTRDGQLTVEIDDNLGKDVQVAVSQGGEKVKVADAKSGWTLNLGAGKYDLAVDGGDDRFQLDSQNITLTHGGQVKVKVTFKPAAPAIAPFDTQQAKKFQDMWARQLGMPVEFTNSIGMKLTLIPPGEFSMGSPKELIEEELKRPDAEQWYKNRMQSEGPQHRVRITRPFYLATYLVTQQEYQRVMGNNPSDFSATGKSKDRVAGQETKRFPVETVSWDDAAEFCRKLSNLPEEKTAGHRYILPSEAQWEYACRTGSTGRYGFSLVGQAVPKEYDESGLVDYGWFGSNSGGMPHPVGLKRPNAWGLYDMHGNVWEWCQDWFDKNYYANTTQDDPAGAAGGSHRVIRGGSWFHPPVRCRSAVSDDNLPGYSHSDLGFRVSLVLPDKPEAVKTDAEKTLPNTRSSTSNPPNRSWDTPAEFKK